MESPGFDTSTCISGLDLNSRRSRGGGVIRPSLGTWLVNLLPAVAQQTNTSTLLDYGQACWRLILKLLLVRWFHRLNLATFYHIQVHLHFLHNRSINSEQRLPALSQWSVYHSAVFVSPVQPCPIPGKSTFRWFHVLIIGLPHGMDKEEWRNDQVGNQLSYTPYYAASPKRHATVIIEKTKRTPSLVLHIFTRQWLQRRVRNNSQLHDLNQRLLKRKEESHPHEQKPLPKLLQS